MRAIVMHEFGGPDVLTLEDVSPPTTAAGEILVRVGATTVSSTRDLGTRSGTHFFSPQITLPHILGGDFAGIVEAVSDTVDPNLRGARVAVSNTVACGSCRDCREQHSERCPNLKMLGIHLSGSYGELVAVPAVNATIIPDDMTLIEAAALAANGPIALTQLLTSQAEVGDWLLVPGATGALGSTLSCLAAHRGANTVTMSRRWEQLPTTMGCAGSVSPTDPNLVESLLKLTGGRGVDAVADNVAVGAVFAAYRDALAIGARVVVSGAIGSPQETTLPVSARALYIKSQSLIGVRTTNERDIKRFWGLVNDGFRLPPGLFNVFPIQEAAAAHTAVATGAQVGTTILAFDGVETLGRATSPG